MDARRGYWLRTEESGHISGNAIVHGDWNSVADVALDVKYAEKSSGEYSNSHGSAIASLLAHRGLTDLFRRLNGEARQYTRQGNTVYTRIERMTAPKYNSKWRWRQVHTNWFPELNSDHMPVCALVDTIQPNKSSQQDARIDPRYLEHQEVRQRIKDMHSRSQRLQNTTATERWEAFKQQATTFLLDYTRRQKTRKTAGKHKLLETILNKVTTEDSVDGPTDDYRKLTAQIKGAIAGEKERLQPPAGWLSYIRTLGDECPVKSSTVSSSRSMQTTPSARYM